MPKRKTSRVARFGARVDGNAGTPPAARARAGAATPTRATAELEDARARARELVCETLCAKVRARANGESTSTSTSHDSANAMEIARAIRESEKKRGATVERDWERATLDALEELEKRGVVEKRDRKGVPLSARERMEFKQRYALAKGVAEAMRAMNRASTPEEEEEEEEEEGEGRGVERGARDGRETSPVVESESDDDHFDDSFDEIDGDDGVNNFSFNVETDTDAEDDSLHAQMVEFAKNCEPTAHERERRDKLFDAIEASISRAYGSLRCSLHVFGSGATGLALAGADIDLVLLGVGPQSRKGGGGGFTRSERDDIVQHLRKIARFLRKDNAVSRAEIIATAKVPIVKMKSAVPPYIAVDLSLGTSNGLDAVDWIREQVLQYSALRPLVFFIKRLLATHRLNDAATGGCGGYLLVSLVVSHLKQTGTIEAVNKPGILGDLLVGFLRRFGSAFDYSKCAVAASRESGVMSASALPGPPFGERPYIMAEDPQEPLRCFTAAAYRFREVQNLFRLTAERIMVSGELSLLPEVAAPPSRALSFFKPNGGELVKVRKNTIVRRDVPGSSTGARANHHQFIRKKNAANSFSPNKPDWTDDRNERNAALKRPRGANSWAAGGHRGYGGDIQTFNPAKRAKSVNSAYRGHVKRQDAKRNDANSSRAKSKPKGKRSKR